MSEEPIYNSMRNAFITLNHYTEEDFEKFFTAFKASYVVVGREVGKKSKIPHLHAYIEFKSSVLFSTIKKRFPRANIQRRRQGATAHQAASYCKKENNFREEGKISNQGERTDIHIFAQAVLGGEKTVEEILCEEPEFYHQYGRTLEKLEDVRMRKVFRNFRTKGIWYFGKTGVGKSYKAFENYSPETHYVLPLEDGKWWDGYRQQETVIIEEFRGQLMYAQLLKMLDCNPYSVPRRNREPLPFMSKTIIITSSLHPSEVFKNLAENDSLEQLMDRIEVVELTGENKRVK